MAGLYIHIPYCTRKCLYCDFYSGGARIADWDRLVSALCNEFDLRLNEIGDPRQITTIYLGGGTPSLMPVSHLKMLTDYVSKYSPNIIEFTIEANPDDVNEEKARGWKEAGINRVSLGIQSFNDIELTTVGRRHTGGVAINAYNLLTKYFTNISIDLIYDMPGQTDESWQTNLNIAVKLSPRHISAYSMMYEPGTALTLLRDEGKIRSADDKTVERWYEMMVQTLNLAGYEHYEISNFAKPGFRSKHNSLYWQHQPYLGLGPSAHSYDGKYIRRANPRDIRGYLNFYACDLPSISHDSIDRDNQSEHTFYIEENLSEEEIWEEIIMLRLRTAEGINLEEIEKRFGAITRDRILKKATPIILAGNLELNDNHLHLTQKGVLLSDNIILSLA